jgi:hypothetical protein
MEQRSMEHRPRALWIWLFVLILSAAGGNVSALDFFNGRIKLVLHEDSGHFSLYYLIDMPQQRDVHTGRYEPFFADQDPRTSFLTVMVNDRIYRLGESPVFKMRIRNNALNPAIIFESPLLAVIQEFTFIRTADSALTDGIRMNITLESRGDQPIQAGIRFLLDTNLGENTSTPYIVNQQAVTSEFVLDSRREEPFWISRNNRLGFMGSISSDVVERPDLIHFANWKRLSEVSWKLAFTQGRNFNYLPYSINDSAVSYYFDPQPLGRGLARTVAILFAAANTKGFTWVQNVQEVITPPQSLAGSSGNTREEDLITLRDLIARLDDHLAGRQIISEEEAARIELLIAGLKARYGLR